jgi:hypothetical protein
MKDMYHLQSIIFDKIWEMRYWIIYYLDSNPPFPIDYSYGDNDIVMVITDQIEEDLKNVSRKNDHSS